MTGQDACSYVRSQVERDGHAVSGVWIGPREYDGSPEIVVRLEDPGLGPIHTATIERYDAIRAVRRCIDER